MKEAIKGLNGLTLLLMAGLLALMFSLSCAGTEPTAAPAAPAQPAPPIAPTAAPVATSATILPTATAQSVLPTPTRVLPTATAVASNKPVNGGTLRYAYSNIYDTLDPAYQTATPSRRVLFAIYNNLVQMNADGTIGPDLARTWEFSTDGKLVTFHLQSGVKFHDGTPADAQSVKWNYDRYLDTKVGSSRRRELSPPLEKVDVVDPLTVRFTLASAFRPMLPELTVRGGTIASPAGVTKYNSYSDRAGAFGSHPVGSGPFIFQQWVPDSFVSVTRNPDYWDKGLPYLDAIRFMQIPDQKVIFAMLRTGELDVMEELTTTDYELAKSVPSVRVIVQDGVRNRAVWFRTNKAPWNNKALRQAFAYAMDRKTMVNVAYGGTLANVSYDPIPSSNGFWYNPANKTYDYNVQKAKDKLAEAGYASGFSYTQPCRASAYETQWCEIVQTMLANVGIKMSIRPYDQAAYFTDWTLGKYDEPTLGNLRARVDPHQLLYHYWATGGSNNIPTYMNYSNTAYDKLVEDASKIYDVAKAKDMYTQAISIMLEDSPMVFTVAEHIVYAINVNVKNFVPRPDSEPRLRELWIQK